MKGKNFLIGATLYLVVIGALYNRRKTRYTAEETAAQTWSVLRKGLGSKATKQQYGQARAAALQKVAQDPKYEIDEGFKKAYLQQQWVR